MHIEVNEQNPHLLYDGKLIIQTALARPIRACCCTLNGTIGRLSAGAMAFHRDMHLDIPLIADILSFQQKCQALIDK